MMSWPRKKPHRDVDELVQQVGHVGAGLGLEERQHAVGVEAEAGGEEVGEVDGGDDPRQQGGEPAGDAEAHGDRPAPPSSGPTRRWPPAARRRTRAAGRRGPTTRTARRPAAAPPGAARGRPPTIPAPARRGRRPARRRGSRRTPRRRRAAPGRQEDGGDRGRHRQPPGAAQPVVVGAEHEGRDPAHRQRQEHAGERPEEEGGQPSQEADREQDDQGRDGGDRRRDGVGLPGRELEGHGRVPGTARMVHEPAFASAPQAEPKRRCAPVAARAGDLRAARDPR